MGYHSISDPVENFRRLRVNHLYEPGLRWRILFRNGISDDEIFEIVRNKSLPPGPLDVLTDCLYNTPAFKTVSPDSLRDNRTPPQELRCRNRISLVYKLAWALFEYEMGWHAIDQPKDVFEPVRAHLQEVLMFVREVYQYLPQELRTRRNRS